MNQRTDFRHRTTPRLESLEGRLCLDGAGVAILPDNVFAPPPDAAPAPPRYLAPCINDASGCLTP
jgi:hypothetical protein